MTKNSNVSVFNKEVSVDQYESFFSAYQHSINNPFTQVELDHDYAIKVLHEEFLPMMYMTQGSNVDVQVLKAHIVRDGFEREYGVRGGYEWPVEGYSRATLMVQMVVTETAEPSCVRFSDVAYMDMVTY